MIKKKLRLLRLSARARLNEFGLEETVLLASITLYTVIMSYLTILRMYALESSAWDLGNYNQAMYTFVFHGQMFYMTPDLLNNPAGSLFGVHFSPIFFLQAPVYFLYPRPETLLVIQSFVLASGIIPTYLIAREIFSQSKWRLLLSFSYLLNPAILGINWFDFHPELYVPTFFLFVIYFYMKKEWIGFWAFSFLLMSTIEFAPIMTFVFGLGMILRDILWPLATHRQSRVDRRLLLNLIFLIVVSALWFMIADRIMLIFAPQNPLMVGRTEHWPTLGASNIKEVPFAIVFHLDRAIAGLLVDFPTKILYLVIIFLPWLLLPLSSLTFWMLSFYWLVPALLSSNVPFYTLGLQYPSFFIAQATYFGIISLKKISSKVPKSWHLTAVCLLISLALSNPVISLKVSTNEWAAYGLPYLSPKANAVRALLEHVPNDASVLTNNNIFPLVSSRLNAYTIPWQINFPKISFFTYVDQTVKKVDYVILETDQWWPLTALILSRTKDFGVLGYMDGILLLKRGYQGDPVSFKPYTASFNSGNTTAPEIVLVTGSSIFDSVSKSGTVYMRGYKEEIGTDFWWGPWIYLSAPGIYEVTFWLRKGESYSGNVMTVDATVFPARIQSKIHGSSITGYYQSVEMGSMEKKLYSGVLVKGEVLKIDEYAPVSFNISANTAGYYEFRGVNVTASIPIFLDEIDLRMVKPLPHIEPVFIQFENYSSFLFEENHSQRVINISRFIPDNASLLLQNELFALVVRNGISYPVLLNCSQNASLFEARLQELLQEVEFIMLDWKSNLTVTAEVLSHLSDSQDFGIFAFADGVTLLKKHFEDRPILFEPLVSKFTYKDLNAQLGTYVVEDPASVNWFVLAHNKTGSDFWWGPYVSLFPGRYEVVFNLKIQNKTEADFLTLSVSRFDWKIDILQLDVGCRFEVKPIGNKVEVANRTVSIQDIKIGEAYFEIRLELMVDTFGQFEFPGRYVKTDSEIRLDEIELNMLEAHANFKIP